MRGLWGLFGGQVGDLLLVGSLVTAPPTWLGSIELLSALGLNGAIAAFVSGLYVWGRIAVSGVVLVRRAHRGDLTLGTSGLLPGTSTAAPTSFTDPLMAGEPAPMLSVTPLPDDVDDRPE